MAQSRAANVFTGVTTLNVGEQPAQVTLQVFDEMRILTGEASFEVPPGYRVVDLLEGPSLLGGGSEQVKGHIRINSTAPLVTFALFGAYDSTFLAAIEGQAPMQ